MKKILRQEFAQPWRKKPRNVNEMLQVCGKKSLGGKKDLPGAVWGIATTAEFKKNLQRWNGR